MRGKSHLIWISSTQEKALIRYCELHGLVNRRKQVQFNYSEVYRTVLCFIAMKKGLNDDFKQWNSVAEVKMLSEVYDNARFEDRHCELYRNITIECDKYITHTRDSVQKALGLKHKASIIRCFLDSMNEIFEKEGYYDHD